ncbi:MAG: hypothetical protein IPK72_02415 [Candidatus Eisenbacteria bacterium]|nr:hypothetical protein [Candidatus Eisenbacteria bacterium]
MRRCIPSPTSPTSPAVEDLAIDTAASCRSPRREPSTLRAVARLGLATALMLLAGTAPCARAGDNDGGLLMLHVLPPGAVPEPACDSIGVASCVDLTTRVNGDELAHIAVLAMWPDSLPPVLKGMSFALSYDPEQIEVLDWGSCAPFVLSDPGWPASGVGMAISWDVPEVAPTVPVIWLSVRSISEGPAALSLAAHPTQGGWFADGHTPARLDAIRGYGAIGFDRPGLGYCLAPPSGCCSPDGTCTRVHPAICVYSGGQVLQGACDDPAQGGPSITDRVIVVGGLDGYEWARPRASGWNDGCPPDVLNLTSPGLLAFRTAGPGSLRLTREKRVSNQYRGNGRTVTLLGGGELELRSFDVLLRDGPVIGAIRNSEPIVTHERLQLANPANQLIAWLDLQVLSPADTVAALCTVDSASATIRFEALARAGEAFAFARCLSGEERILSEVGQYCIFDFQGDLVETNVWIPPTGVPDGPAGSDAPSGVGLQLLGASPVQGEIRYLRALSQPGVIDLELIDIQGRMRAVVERGQVAAGVVERTWPLPHAIGSGLYFIRLRADGLELVSRVLILRGNR